MNRYDVRLTETGTDNFVTTFTWGDTYEDALARVSDVLESDPLWDGWNAEVKEI